MMIIMIKVKIVIKHNDYAGYNDYGDDNLMITIDRYHDDDYVCG